MENKKKFPASQQKYSESRLFKNGKPGPLLQVYNWGGYISNLVYKVLSIL